MHPSKKRKTIFIDIDGVLIFQLSGNDYPDRLCDISHSRILPGAKDKLAQWAADGHYIILTTARKESYRKETISELKYHRIIFDRLIMGLPSGQRILINDNKPEDINYPMALGISLERDKGIADLKLDSETTNEFGEYLVGSNDILLIKDKF